MPDRYFLGGQQPYWAPRPPAVAGGLLGRKSAATKWFRLAGWTLAGAGILAALGLLFIYRALKHVPEFYQRAIEIDPDAAQLASRMMGRQVAGLASDLNKPGPWQAVFTAEQINGWLAVDLAKDYPGMLPPGFSDPRVRIAPEGLTVACRYRAGMIDTVISATVDVYLSDPRSVALRVRKVRAGAVRLPLGKLLEEISQVGTRLDWEVRWRRANADPVALVSIPRPRKPGDRLVELQAVQLGDGEIRIAGTSRQP